MKLSLSHQTKKHLIGVLAFLADWFFFKLQFNNQKVIFHEEGGRGGQDPPKKDDIICEQPLITLCQVPRVHPGLTLFK